MATLNGTTSDPGSDKLDYWSELMAEELLPVLSIIILYLVLGTVGNLFVMYMYWFGNQTSNEDRFFIPFLALADFCACVVCSVAEIFTQVNPLRFDSDVGCKMSAFLGIAFVTMSSNLLLVITIDRYLKICRPFRSQMTLDWKKFALVLIVADGIIVSAPSVGVYGSVPVSQWNVTGRLCINVPSGETRVWHLTYKTIVLVIGSLHFLALVVLYILIIRSIHIQSQTRVRLHSIQWEYKRPSQSNITENKSFKQNFDKTGKIGLSQTNTVTDRNATKTPADVVITDSIREVDDDIVVEATKEDEQQSRIQPSDDEIDCTIMLPDDIDYFASSEDDGTDDKTDSMCAQHLKTARQDTPHSSSNKHRRYKHYTKSANQRKSNNTGSSKSDKRYKIKGLQLTLVFLVITIIYVITLCLKLVLMTMESAYENFWTTLTPSQFVGFRFMYNVFIINHIVNPFVYGFMDRQFQSSIKDRCTCRYH